MQQDHHVNSGGRTQGNGWPQSCIEILVLCHLTVSAGPVIKEVEAAVGSGRAACLPCAKALAGRCELWGAVAGPSLHYSVGHLAMGNSAGALCPTALHPRFLSFTMERAWWNLVPDVSALDSPTLTRGIQRTSPELVLLGCTTTNTLWVCFSLH